MSDRDRRLLVATELDRAVRMIGLKPDSPDAAALTQGPFARIIGTVEDAQRQIIEERAAGERLARINLEHLEGLERYVDGLTRVMRERTAPIDRDAIEQVAASFADLRQAIESIGDSMTTEVAAL